MSHNHSSFPACHRTFTPKESSTDGSFTGTLDDEDSFGWAMAELGDLNGDGTVDLAVGAPRVWPEFDGRRGVVWVLFLNPDGTVKSHQEIGEGKGGFTGKLQDSNWFGCLLQDWGILMEMVWPISQSDHNEW